MRSLSSDRVATSALVSPVILSRGEVKTGISYEEALADFNRAIKLDSKYSWAFAERGKTYQNMKRYTEALADFNRAIELDPKNDWAIAGREETYHLMEKYQEALADFNRAIEELLKAAL